MIATAAVVMATLIKVRPSRIVPTVLKQEFRLAQASRSVAQKYCLQRALILSNETEVEQIIVDRRKRVCQLCSHQALGFIGGEDSGLQKHIQAPVLVHYPRLCTFFVILVVVSATTVVDLPINCRESVSRTSIADTATKDVVVSFIFRFKFPFLPPTRFKFSSAT